MRDCETVKYWEDCKSIADDLGVPLSWNNDGFSICFESFGTSRITNLQLLKATLEGMKLQKDNGK